MEKRTLYLVRHGRIRTRDDERIFIGQLDLPLTEEGIQQARCLQKAFQSVDLSAVFCSDLVRSRQMAEVITEGRNIPIVPRRDLREISLGRWEGRPVREIAQKFPADFAARGENLAHFRTPEGETFCECSERVIKAVDDILRSSEGDCLIVGHSGVNRVLLAHIMGVPIENIARISQDYGCLNVLEFGSFGQRVGMLNGSGDTWFSLARSC